MPTLSLRSSRKAVAAYYEALAAFAKLGVSHELAVKSAFAALLEAAAKPFGCQKVSDLAQRKDGDPVRLTRML